ncbi:MAG: N-acetylneuraminate synthase [Lentimicrobiaceae bacterium]|jgi:N-acetylneuraminate synthase|nr:N-acetylneuraminate synthase [Lentimicrobiaceae bacterium]MDY0024700.1 N-acetylneuraminate synthase [Lentimicrobium sp.]HAH57868.1 N-acetylneuraminate synthase [Bacteroidales bacterium]
MNNKIIIIAEAGVNHDGKLKQALQLIDEAAISGADYIKFQTFNASKLVSASAAKAAYQSANTGKPDESQHSMLEALALDFDDFRTLNDYCLKKHIGFLSSGFDHESILFIDSLGVDYHKIPSGEITNLPMLQLIGSLGRKVLLSTGMATLHETELALNILFESGTPKDNITVLQCTTEYPAPYDEVNLNVMHTMREAFNVKIGYSDHTPGIVIPIAASAMGAAVIEKHFTLDRNLPGPDHKASLEPDELAEMVKAIRLVEQAMGDGIKVPGKAEQKNILVARRSIHLSKKVSSGHELTASDLVMKRPGHGISPMKINDVIGRKVAMDLNEDTLLMWEHLQ